MENSAIKRISFDFITIILAQNGSEHVVQQGQSITTFYL